MKDLGRFPFRGLASGSSIQRRPEPAPEIKLDVIDAKLIDAFRGSIQPSRVLETPDQMMGDQSP